MPYCAPDQIQLLVLERIEPAANMARYYVLSVEPTLFADTAALVRQWGRIGKPGRRRIDLHASGTAAAESLEVWLARKLARGYRVRKGAAARERPGIVADARSPYYGSRSFR